MYMCTKIYFPEQSQQQQKNNSRIKKKIGGRVLLLFFNTYDDFFFLNSDNSVTRYNWRDYIGEKIPQNITSFLQFIWYLVTVAPTRFLENTNIPLREFYTSP